MHVVILMSTYQGERFVEEQLTSILTQLPINGRILVRDDGSRDGTVAKIEGLGDARISVMRGENIGFVRSFLTLLESAPADADMVMLSDQDDVWLPTKIERAQHHLRGYDAVPTLYCSRLKLVDDQLRPLGLSPEWPRAPSFPNALTENIVTGCTAAMNRAALSLVKQHGDPSRIYFHDWWLYLVVAAFGQVIVDAEPTILYRQHGGNAIGMGSGLHRYWTVLRFLRKRNWVHIMFNQIENFRNVHAHTLSTEHRLLLDRTFNPHMLTSAARLLVSPNRYRQTLLSDFLFRMILLFDIVTGRGLLPKSVGNQLSKTRQVTLK